jgi:hypothetical protein
MVFRNDFNDKEVREFSCQLYEKEIALKRKLSQGKGVDNINFHCFKNLRKEVY